MITDHYGFLDIVLRQNDNRTGKIIL